MKVSRTAKLSSFFMFAFVGLSVFSCGRVDAMEVTASAYNSVVAQTDDEPLITASGHKLKPGQKVIAVSRDLLDIGLEFGTPVKIDGLKGEYIVEDTMAARWEKHIDIYMGKDIEAAKEWGRRNVTINW